MFYVKSKHISEEIIKKSRFIGAIIPCQDENSALLQLRQLYAEHPNANHIAFAYRIKTANGIVYRFHDAGEPTGTAGKPILQHLEGKQLINLLVAVVRYFGGVKLGAGGLTRAYSNAAKQAIAQAELLPYVELISVQLTIDYSQMQSLEYLLNKIDGQLIKQEFAEQIHMHIQLPVQQLPNLLQSYPAAKA